MSAKTTKQKTPAQIAKERATAARERVRAARAEQLAEQVRREGRIEDAATAYYLSLDKLEQLGAQREEALREFDQGERALELEQAKVIAELRSLETVANIADLLGVSTAEVTRLSKLTDAAPAAGAASHAQPAAEVQGPSWPSLPTSQASDEGEGPAEEDGHGGHVAA
ncbi:hypothetical protein ACI2IX_20020 [Leifsonia aquatica]|uniref:hypothetical protein n=1 Tax=Leifsonia aquatica TaxID=144185 RepID=UPI00384E158E